MSDLIDDPEPGQNTPEYSVGEITGAIKRTLERSFERVRVRGEIGRVMLARSGHYYYDLKDENSVIACNTWKGQASRLTVKPEEGLEVIVTGKLSTYGPQSKYNLNVDDIVVAGEGALLAMLEKRRKKLAAEGLFDEERKMPLPYLPEVIGVVTSPSGAVIRDILHRLRDRFPRKVLLWPVVVQGDKCAPEVSAAIAGFNAIDEDHKLPRPDLIIVARGGGSVEDLWGFNEEAVIRAVAASDIPVISAVGHETDTTLIDFASDRRAPTPTAAAEMAVPVRVDLLAHIAALDERRIRAGGMALQTRAQRLRDLARALPKPEAILSERLQRLDRSAENLPRALRQLTSNKRAALAASRAGGFGPALLTQRLLRASDRLETRANSLAPLLSRRVELGSSKLSGIANRLHPRHLQTLMSRKSEPLVLALTRLTNLATRQTTGLRARLNELDRVRTTLGYEATLARGYVVVRGADGLLLAEKAKAEKEAALELQFRDGRLKVGEGAPVKKPARKPKPAPKGEQGSLF